MSEFECIDCGEWSEALLPERFPHICSRCLFPPTKDARSEDNRNGEMLEAMRTTSRSIMRDLTYALPKQGPAWTQ